LAIAFTLTAPSFNAADPSRLTGAISTETGARFYGMLLPLRQPGLDRGRAPCHAMHGQSQRRRKLARMNELPDRRAAKGQDGPAEILDRHEAIGEPGIVTIGSGKRVYASAWRK
jgi:hypothetical protein